MNRSNLKDWVINVCINVVSVTSLIAFIAISVLFAATIAATCTGTTATAWFLWHHM